MKVINGSLRIGLVHFMHESLSIPGQTVPCCPTAKNGHRGKLMLITLLTDFGLEDGYVAAMKGVISCIAPQAALIDITHAIAPQNIAAGRFHLMSTYPYFPDRSVHLAVVDPGVGTTRRAVAIETATAFFVGPDNGLFEGVLSQTVALGAVELTEPRYWRNITPSPTFHGRDIFAPVAAHLAMGVPLAALGSKIDPDTLVCLPLPKFALTGSGGVGAIQAIDHFGNLITNIPGALVAGRDWTLSLADRELPGCRTFADVPTGQALAIVGSQGWLTVAVNGGSARAQFQALPGGRVHLRWRDQE